MRCSFLSNMRPLLSLHSPISPPLSLNLSPSVISPKLASMARANGGGLTAVRSACGGHVDGQDRSAEVRSGCGEIHLIVGPMFAGKTTELLKRVQSELSFGRNVAVVKSSKDNRYASDSVVTHDGTKMSCWALSHLSDLRDTLGFDAYNKIDVIGIDEAQFFDDLHGFCCDAADRDGKTVIIAGLDGDYMRKKFGSVLDILPLADSVTKLSARCEICGASALFTLRKSAETQTELIGGKDKYMPVCRRHYVDGQTVIQAATRIVLDVDVDVERSAVARA